QELAKSLIQSQFPEFSNLQIRKFHPNGWDHATFRLGDEMVMRLPTAERYAAQVNKEQQWLPFLSEHLSITIPQPIALGQPSQLYPWSWSIYRWIEGYSVNTLNLNEQELESLAIQLAHFINELHTIDVRCAPKPGRHNFLRGSSPIVYHAQMLSTIQGLKEHIEIDIARAVWEKAIRSQWTKDPVWVHGDLSAGNLLIKNHRLNAVIDFGCIAVGDPSCDLAIAWMLFKNRSREVFQSLIQVDKQTWDRARGWALWKACITLQAISNQNAEFEK
ncbi:MAG: aminoglycoside phosphotransferase family protein, partial [Simkaniaceae bacterium]|nr:aminoglycoside phosphotransferase family protein [Simkaniaceae bacterium]